MATLFFLIASQVATAFGSEARLSEVTQKIEVDLPLVPQLLPAKNSFLSGVTELLSALYQVQDSIVIGERSALRLQRDILWMMREQIVRISKADVSSESDIEPVLIFALAGGDPVVAVKVLAFVPTEHPNAELAMAVVSYLRRDKQSAKAAFANVDPTVLPMPLAAFVAMAKANANISIDRPAAVVNLGIVRLLAPGTLLEEIAMRRLVKLSSEDGVASYFLRLSSSYINRFERSPFYSQFLEFFIEGALSSTSHDGILQVLDLMAVDVRIRVSMALSRKAILAGKNDLASNVSGRLLADLAGKADERVQRAHLYAGLAEIGNGEIDLAVTRLKDVKKANLPTSDQGLLEAALDSVRFATVDKIVEKGIKSSPAAEGVKADHDMVVDPSSKLANTVPEVVSEQSSIPQLAANPEEVATAELKPLMDDAAIKFEAVNRLILDISR